MSFDISLVLSFFQHPKAALLVFFSVLGGNPFYSGCRCCRYCHSGGQAYVYTYDQAAGTARKVAIEDGLIGSERIQVLSGLDYSDQVITTWTKELYEGAPVQLAEGAGTDAETSLDGGESAGAGESPEGGNGEAPMTDAPGEPAADAAAGDAEAPEPAAEETSAEETSANAQ